jgi:uncharacterized protein YggE
MKSTIFTALMLLVMLATSAQTIPNPYPKTINVTGSAEMEVVPDEIYVQVELKEYEKKGGGKVGIEKIRQQFLAHAKSIGLPDSLISIAAYDSYNANPWLRKKKKKEELYATISYQLKLKSSTQLDALVDGLDDEATANFFIQRTSHSRLADYRRQLKIEAVKAAKEKARYLAEAIDEQVSVAVTIQEPVEYFIPYYNQRVSNMMVRSKAADGADMAPEQGNADFTKLKLKYDVTVTFALK